MKALLNIKSLHIGCSLVINRKNNIIQHYWLTMVNIKSLDIVAGIIKYDQRYLFTFHTLWITSTQMCTIDLTDRCNRLKILDQRKFASFLMNFY